MDLELRNASDQIAYVPYSLYCRCKQSFGCSELEPKTFNVSNQREHKLVMSEQVHAFKSVNNTMSESIQVDAYAYFCWSSVFVPFVNCVKQQRGMVGVCLSACLGVVHGATTPVISHGSVWPQALTARNNKHTLQHLCSAAGSLHSTGRQSFFLHIHIRWLLLFLFYSFCLEFFFFFLMLSKKCIF